MVLAHALRDYDGCKDHAKEHEEEDIGFTKQHKNTGHVISDVLHSLTVFM